MSLLTAFVVKSDKQEYSAVVTTAARALYLGLFCVAMFLAIKDLSLLPNLSSKIWFLLWAATMPELYIILHALAASAANTSFFDASPSPFDYFGPGPSAEGDLPEMLPPPVSSRNPGFDEAVKKMTPPLPGRSSPPSGSASARFPVDDTVRKSLPTPPSNKYPVLEETTTSPSSLFED